MKCKTCGKEIKEIKATDILSVFSSINCSDCAKKEEEKKE